MKDRVQPFAIAQKFQIEGTITEIKVYGSGHINDTFALTCRVARDSKRFLLQRLNSRVFKKPETLMENLLRVTSHIRTKLEQAGIDQVKRRILTLVPTKKAAPFYMDDEAHVWRMFHFIEGARTYDSIRDPDQAFEAGNAFGTFQRLLIDLPPPRLHEVIPGFHDTEGRFALLQEVHKQDVCGRSDLVLPEIEFIENHAEGITELKSLQQTGRLEERIVHYDTKFNNVMIDDWTSKWICVIDLDTVGPGFSLYDFGDLMRTGVSDTKEDEPDLTKITVRMPLFSSLVRGYLAEAAGFLNFTEITHLVTAGKVMILESGIRFLTDFLEGDPYFKIYRENHNLDRCRVQLRLLESICAREVEMRKIVEREYPRNT